jgi:KUP system potassium uptake protein
MSETAPGKPQSEHRGALTLAALGVVFGDIGTSPLYALRECFVGVSGFPVDDANILGIVSLITWSLVIIVSIKYVGVVLRVDNQGEGGVLALAHRILPDDIEAWGRGHWALIFVGLFAAALLFGDGIITPALSVLSAVEGLAVAAPSFEGWVIPLTLVILVGLFAIQSRGTGRVGRLFGPVMVLWFSTLALLGAYRILEYPLVLGAVDPRHAFDFFVCHGFHGTLILGAVFLAVTGAEAMYADLGHFGRPPIERAWFFLVLPALLLNYYGQGALLLQHPDMVDDVFYYLAPHWGLVPLVALATLATIIASQAVISGVFSLTAQAVRLQYFPRMRILHTSSAHRGQIYVPVANFFLVAGTLTLVLLFRSSSSLADAYGIAVSLTMVLTTLLLFFVMRWVWRWPLVVALAVFGVFWALDLSFFLSIFRKVMSGGWIPLSIALILLVVMGVWRRGRQLVHRRPIRMPADAIPRTEQTLVFLMRAPFAIPEGLEAIEGALFVHVDQCHRPFMNDTPHGEVSDHNGKTMVHACYGFMENPDVPALLVDLAQKGQLVLGEHGLRYVLMRERFGPQKGFGPGQGLKRLYDLLAGKRKRLGDAFQIPPHQVLEIQPVILDEGQQAG